MYGGVSQPKPVGREACSLERERLLYPGLYLKEGVRQHVGPQLRDLQENEGNSLVPGVYQAELG